jgi:hypothetical protein
MKNVDVNLLIALKGFIFYLSGPIDTLRCEINNNTPNIANALKAIRVT